MTDGGLDSLRRELAAAVRVMRPLSVVRLPADSGKLLADLYRDAEVLNVGSEGSALVVRARMDDAMAGRLRRAGATVSAGGRA